MASVKQMPGVLFVAHQNSFKIIVTDFSSREDQFTHDDQY
jgi:hypothetical protein